MTTSRVGILLFEVQRVLDRCGAADPAAIGPLFISRSHALDHDDAIRPRERALHQLFFQLHLRHDAIVFSVCVKPARLQLLAARCHNDNTVLQLARSLCGAMQETCLEITLESRMLNHAGLGHHVNQRMRCGLLYQVRKKLLGIEAVNSRIDVPQVASQFCFFFHEKDFEVLLGKLQGRCHAGKPAAQHEGLLVHVHGDLFERQDVRWHS